MNEIDKMFLNSKGCCACGDSDLDLGSIMEIKNWNETFVAHYVECKICGKKTSNCPTEIQAILEWNKINSNGKTV